MLFIFDEILSISMTLVEFSRSILDPIQAEDIRLEMSVTRGFTSSQIYASRGGTSSISHRLIQVAAARSLTESLRSREPELTTPIKY